MATTTFDTLKFVRRLQQAGMPVEQAEVHAEVLTEAFTVNLESLVTREHLAAGFATQNASIDARFAEQNASIDVRFAEQNASIDARFAKMTAYMDTRFAEQNASIDARFAEQGARIDARFARMDARFNVITWILAVITAGVFIPLLERLSTL